MIVTVAGNYPRISERTGGQALRRALAQLDEGKIDWSGVRQVQDEVVREVIEEQVETGIDLVTDGLIRWDDPVTYIARGLSSFEIQGLVRWLDTNTFYRQPLAQQAVAWREPITVADWQYASSVSSRPVKAVLTGPYTIGRLSRSAVHQNPDDLVRELAEALRSEVQALHAAGAPLVQIDEPLIARQPGDWPLFKEAMGQLCAGATGTLELNANYGSLDRYDDLFSLPFDIFALDLIQGPRNWELLPRVPPDKEIVLGIVDAREVRLEEPAEIARTLSGAARHLSSEQMHVSPNCGLEFLPREAAAGKLRRMAQGVRVFVGQRIESAGDQV